MALSVPIPVVLNRWAAAHWTSFYTHASRPRMEELSLFDFISSLSNVGHVINEPWSDCRSENYYYYYYYYYYYVYIVIDKFLGTVLPLLWVTMHFLQSSKVSSSCFLTFTVNNLLKPAGCVMHQQFNIQQLYALPTLYLCVLYLSENKQRLVPLTA